MSNQSLKLLLCLCVIVSTCHGNPSVTIDQGALEGLELTTQGGRNISGFLGIPYGQPPIGELRFKAPKPASSWNGTYSATNGSIRCTQVLDGPIRGGEDCLHLNVYTPQLPDDDTTLLPVMVYIFGGAFVVGSARIDLYGPNFILDHDVVLVTLNYRLGPLGFLTTGDDVVPGNAGLKDQILALRWVQDNIAAFGGDPDQVTLFGNSAGAAFIHILTLSDLGEGLFHKFILQSGTATSIWAYRDSSNASVITANLAKSFNCSTVNSSVIVNCLRKQDAASLMSWSYTGSGYAFIPTNEPESDEAVITDSPRNLVNQLKMRDLPWISGFTSEEGLLFSAPYIISESQRTTFVGNLKQSIDAVTNLFDVANITEYTNDIMKFYFNDLTVDQNLIVKNYTDFMSDAYFIYPAVDLLQAQSVYGTEPAYVYMFDYQGTYSFTYRVTGNATVLGTCHSDELFYLFLRSDPRYVPSDRNMSETDLEMSRRITGLWASFATNGVPRLTGVEDAEDWLEYDLDVNYLRIGNKSDVSLVMESTIFQDRMNFWKDLVGSIIFGGI